MSQGDLRQFERLFSRLSHQEKLELLEYGHNLLDEQPTVSVEEQLKSFRELQRELAALPVHNPNDGFSSEDHDQILYGGKW